MYTYNVHVHVHVYTCTFLCLRLRLGGIGIHHSGVKVRTLFRRGRKLGQQLVLDVEEHASRHFETAMDLLRLLHCDTARKIWAMLTGLLFLYLVHVQLAHIRIGITLDRNKIWVRDLYHSTALIEAAKSLALLNVIGHG